MDAHTKHRTFATIIRSATDLFLVNLCLFFAVWVGFIVKLLAKGNEQIILSDFTDKFYAYVSAFLIISLATVAIFTLSGVYSRVRSLSGRYKALHVFSAVSAAFAIFYIINNFSVISPIISQSFIFTAWLMTSVVMMTSRVWSVLWRRMTIRAVSQNELPHYIDDKTVLVIGGAGYIGSALVPKLLKDGFNVRILDMLVYGDDAIKPYLSSPQLELIKADFRQVDAVVNAVKGVSSVIHLGAIVGDPACAIDENMTIEINLMATRMIAEVCKGFGVKRFIFASTCSVYGASDEVLDETSALSPVSLYAKSKIACEQVLQKMADDQFSPVVLRFSTIFGLSGRMRFDLVVNLLSAKAILDGEITVINGDQWRPFLHVDDAALSVFSALKAPLQKVKKQVFNVGSDRLNYTIKQAGELINQQVPSAKLLDLESDQDRRNYRVSFEKIHSQLGYDTQWSLEQGITQVLTAVREGHVTSYREPKYSNAVYLKEALLYRDHSAYYHTDMEELALNH
ncbi:MAG: NAD-dependent epimerase/dehydratase family protein [Coxiellaceae bacterium]|nr:NAD-dependent epimerase/dehydratase family protein [Coxiellaceae bacterium]